MASPAKATRPDGDPLQILYVGGVPRSGSTLTDLVLHHLPDHFGVGETFYLWHDCLLYDTLCACGRTFSQCDFWQAVGETAFGGWHNVDAQEVLRLQSIVDKTTAVPGLLLPRRPQRFQQALDAYTTILINLYQGIASVSGASVIVDSSKRPSMAFLLRATPEIDLRIVHVVRDPRGVTFSFAKHVALDPGAGPREEMPRSSARTVGRRWVTVNAMIASLARLGVPYELVRYEDLVASPRAVLSRVLAMESMSTADGSLDFISEEGVLVPETHAVAAGRIRLNSGPMPLRYDDAWEREMPTRSRRLVERITWASRRRYGYGPGSPSER